ncbi:MAG TPA: RDD family protein [Candidatus Dormibacteraeota bacterium]|nr:RDD family protein [Candidatus Dormibacteraeota bacterium]
MSEQPMPPAEPVTAPAAQPAQAYASAPSASSPYASTQPPAASPPVYDWQRPVEEAGPAPGIRFAGYGARLVAWVVDGFIVGVTVVIVAFALAILAAIFANGGSNAAAGLTGLLLFIAILAITFGYFPWFWSRGGQTPGMRMLRIRVVRDRDGGPVTGGQAILRLIGYWVSGAVFYLGYIWVFIDGRRRGWHDLIAGTCVIEA